MTAAEPLPPGATIGILGGGQLGRMTALAAARLGYRTHVFCQSAEEPAALVTPFLTAAPFTDLAAVDGFAREVQAATLEFENVPRATVERLEGSVPVRPGSRALGIAQDRAAEKEFLAGLGIPVAPYRIVADAEELSEAIRELGDRVVLKSSRFGYDGKGQFALAGGMDPRAAWRAVAAPRGVVELHVDFETEVSVVTARGLDGASAAYVPVENRHDRHILRETRVPARLSPDAAGAAVAMARKIADAIDLVGLLAVEIFVTRDGGLLVNEIAPRPHNSGHWTADACAVSQFEQLVRAVCGLPLGSPERHSDAVMLNLLGDESEAWRELLSDPDARLHLYGKSEARPGRKMGHVTRLRPRADRV